MIYLIALVSIALGSIGQMILKIASAEVKTGNILLLVLSLINHKIIAAISCFVISMFLWIFVLKKLELSVAYPMVSLGYVFVMLLSYFFLQEQLFFTKILGTALIVAGVVVLNIK